MTDTPPNNIRRLAVMAAILLGGWLAAEEKPAEKPKPAIELGAPFADNAVLQRQMPVPVWGWSEPGSKITVEFAGQKKTATAAKDGKWMFELDPMEANATPQTMTVTSSIGNRQSRIANVLVGEVWMASGQSNMQWKVAKSSCSKLRVAAKGKTAPIREFEVTSVYSALYPIERATGAWKNGDYGNYSAIAFAFAHKLYGELDVPIGILNCSFSSTAIEAWVPRVGFADGTDEYTKGIYQRTLETDPTTPEHKAAWNQFYQDLEDTMRENAELVKKGQPAKAVSAKTPGNLNGNRDASWMFNGRLNPVIPYAIRGAIWNQGYSNMGGGITYYNNLHSLVRGWRLRWNRPELPVYFHQFYCPGQRGEWNNQPSIGSAAEMRLGTWLARDIPNANMASQIDVTGSIHYRHKAVPGQRLALHALKNQYGKDIVADGPMFKSYTVNGDKLIVEFDHAEGGLVVAETGSNAIGRGEGATGFADPKIIENGDDQVKLFYLADENRVWYPASMKIDGDKVVVTSPKVKTPRGVSYATGGVGFQPNLYNRALLPLTPFIYYDEKLVTSGTWPDERLKIAGIETDPKTVGKVYEYRKMPLLSTQFRDNAVLQAGMPVTIWGSAIHNWGYEAEGEAVIKFSFCGIEKTIPVMPGMREWQVTVPPMEASAEPKTLEVTFTIDGELVHERVSESVVIGDVWYVAAPPLKFAPGGDGKPGDMVRVMRRRAKRSTSPRPSRYSVCVSTTPKNRFASRWDPAGNDLAGALGARIHARTGKPVGVVFMESRDPELKSWVPFEYLKEAPGLMEDYQDLAAKHPGTPYYNANVKRYLADWKKYWSEYIPEMMATKRVPDGSAWGIYPSFTGSITSTASQTYNVMTHSFTPASFKGIIFFCGQKMFEEDQGANYAPELSALANGWKTLFAGEDPHFFYTIPSKALAPKITKPRDIEGKSTGVEIDDWGEAMKVIEKALSEVYE